MLHMSTLPDDLSPGQAINELREVFGEEKQFNLSVRYYNAPQGSGTLAKTVSVWDGSRVHIGSTIREAVDRAKAQYGLGRTLVTPTNTKL